MKGKWQERHIVILTILLLMLPTSLYIGSINHNLNSSTIIDILSVALFISLSYSPKVSINLREVLAVLGLANSAAVLVFMSHGSFFAHVIFGIVLGLSSIYQDVYLYLIVALYIIVYYGFFAQLHPTFVFDPDLVGNDIVKWSINYSLLSILISIPAVFVAFIAKRTGESEAILQVALSDAALRERQAIEIHDKVIQGLALSIYALDENDIDTTRMTLENTMANAKNLVSGLMEGGAVNITRDEPTGNIN